MIPTLDAICRQHLDFMKWADDLLLNAVAEHVPDRIEVLEHIYLGEVVWIKRVEGDATIRIGDLTRVADLAELRKKWPGLHRRWIEWAASVEDWSAEWRYRLSDGTEGASALWQIVLHLANHGSYHRGQVAAMLRAAGHAPPATDLIRYYRTLG